MKCIIILAITGATGIVTKDLKKNWKPYQENIQKFTAKDSCTSNIT
jgi:hypothetical protein